MAAISKTRWVVPASSELRSDRAATNSLASMGACCMYASDRCLSAPHMIQTLRAQDHWWLSGISRDVVLLAKPARHISDYSVTTPLTFSADGALESARCAALLIKPPG